ncbi:MAG: malonate transporter [Herminiimonas sp.]|nr:malonate transporter [Herminiimonas sp.]
MEAFYRILGIILPVLAIVAVGYGYARLRGASVRTDMVAVNRVSMEVLCPFLMFTALAAKDFDVAHNGLLIVAAVVVSLGSALLAWPVARMFGYDVRTFVPPMLYNNCGNMGLPLSMLAFGPSSLSAAAALWVTSNAVYFSAGIKIVEIGKHGRRSSFRAFITSPMMLATIAGFLFSLAHITVPPMLFQPLKMIGDACIPLMLFALGVRMREVTFKSWQIGLVGAVVCPVTGLIVAWLLDSLFQLTPLQRGQLYLFASLPPAVFCFMIAEQYNQEPDKVASIVMLGNVASLVFVPIGLWLGLP